MSRAAVFPKSLKYLLAVAECSSFTRAAESVFVSQPALSQQIKLLEEQLGTQLLERSGRNVHLTDAGELYVRHVKRALAELNAGSAALDDLSNMSRGNLSLALTPITDYLTLDLIQKFLNDYPNITLQVHEMSQSDVEDAVLRDMVNVGVAFSDENSLTSARTELERISLRTEHLILASGKNESSAPIDSLATLRVELDRHPLALLGSRYEMRRKIDSYFATNNLAPQITLESNSLGFLIELVKRGRLRTILPRSIVSLQEGLTEIPFEPGLPTHNVTLILSKSTYRSRATDCFLRYALNPPFYQKS